MRKENTINLVLAGLFTAIGVAMPQLFHLAGMSGSIFLPMHIPVILCGLICGYKYGGICGFIVPLLSSLLTGMPPLFPIGAYMACELIAYGIVAGLLMKKTNVFVSLIAAMICGRIILGIAQVVFLGINANPNMTFTFGGFITGAFVTALPGIIMQLIAIPAIVVLLKRTRLLPSIPLA